MVFGIEKWILSKDRVFKYGIVGCAGIVVNLGTMALFLALGFQRGWTPSAIASIVSTSGNFILHNCWTFSDRQHRGLRLIRGFLSFALISAIGISITTTFYVGFTRIAAHLTILNLHRGTLEIPLTCQFAAILLSAGASYLLNGAFTWPQLPTASADLAQLQEG
jgi:putative flippase GtrA